MSDVGKLKANVKGLYEPDAEGRILCYCNVVLNDGDDTSCMCPKMLTYDECVAAKRKEFADGETSAFETSEVQESGFKQAYISEKGDGKEDEFYNEFSAMCKAIHKKNRTLFHVRMKEAIEDGRMVAYFTKVLSYGTGSNGYNKAGFTVPDV